MKLLHTSDWHLGKHLNNYERHREQQAVMQEICDIADREQVDAVIVAGDLFDGFNPPIESVDLFYKTLKRLANNGKRAVIAIAGNHDSPDRIEAPDPLARECGILFVGYPHTATASFELETGLKVSQTDKGFVELRLPDCQEPLRLLLTPYANELRLKTYLGGDDPEEALRGVLHHHWTTLANRYCDNKGVNVLVTHLFVARQGDDLPEEPEDERPILHVGGAQVVYTDSIPQQIQYTALGHLHRMHVVDATQGPVVYAGSPLSYSFSEAHQQKFVVLVDVQTGKPATTTPIELTQGRPLLRMRATTVDEAVDWLQQHPNSLVELTMATDTYLKAEERKRLYAAHDGIVMLIPEAQHPDTGGESHRTTIDLTQNMEALFKAYFRSAKGQEPSDAILHLFKEILSEEEDAL
jgi:exonuclease SbcD